MAVGEYVRRKFTWLLGDVELVGIVHYIGDDDFAIIPDPNYEHLTRYFRGNQPLPWSAQGEPGVMHLETYPIDIISDPQRSNGGINRDDFWASHGDRLWGLPQKPSGEPFVVTDRTGASRDLQVGDRVRVTGRWVIDHHPEFCSSVGDMKVVPPRCRWVGALGLQKVGQTHTEFHPFDWKNIRLVEPLKPGDVSQCRVSLAAPLYEQQYVGDWHHAWNEITLVAGRVFIEETPQGTYTNYNTMVGTSIHIAAPPLPTVPASYYRQLVWHEHVLKLGEGMRLDDIRSVTVNQNSVNVQMTIIAPRSSDGSRPTIHGPAQNWWIFQADYLVYWMVAGNEVTCITREPAAPIGESGGRLIGVGGRHPSGESWWLRIHEAVAAARGGHQFYIQLPLSGERVNLVPIGTGVRETLTTDPPPQPGGRPNLLLSLPPCPNPPIIG